MPERSGFFNAQLQSDGTYDRIYNASDFADYFATFIGNGVFVNPADQLKVVAKSGLTVTIKAGKAFIDGYWYILDEDKDITLTSNTGTYAINSLICCTLNKGTRTVSIIERSNVSSILPINDGSNHDLVLASINIGVGTSAITDSVITDRRPDKEYCGYVAAAVTDINTTDLFKQFESSFDEWFQTIKGKLDGDTAGNLQNQIDNLNSQFSGDITDTVKTLYLLMHPVGDLVFTTSNVNPGEIYGGMWELWGSGKVPVCINTDDTDFNTVEKTGGVKSVTLTASQSGIQAHAHGLNSHVHSLGNHVHSLGNHTHNMVENSNYGVMKYNSPSGQIRRSQIALSTSSNQYAFTLYGSADYLIYGNNKTQAASDNTGAASGNTGAASGNTANNTAKNATAAHTNLPPYIVCYMWKRVE